MDMLARKELKELEARLRAEEQKTDALQKRLERLEHAISQAPYTEPTFTTQDPSQAPKNYSEEIYKQAARRLGREADLLDSYPDNIGDCQSPPARDLLDESF